MPNETIELARLYDTRDRLVKNIHASLTDADRKFLLSVKRGEPEWEAFRYPHARDLPAIRWKIYNLEKMAKRKQAEAISKLETVLYR